MKKLQKPSIISQTSQEDSNDHSQASGPIQDHQIDDQKQFEEIVSEDECENQHFFESKNTNSSKVWTSENEKMLFELHEQLGNRWTILARHYNGMCENSIKNRFYSRLRKSIRKINKAITLLELKKYTKFKLNIIFKLSNISEGKMAEKQKIAPQIFQFYRQFLYKLIKFSDQNQNVTFTKQSFQSFDEVENLILPLVALENLFRLVRGERVAKGKKKNIAYLRQFRFRLSLENSEEMEITKENILLVNSNQKTKSQVRSRHVYQESPLDHLLKKSSEFGETLVSDNQEHQFFELSSKESQNAQDTIQTPSCSTSSFRDIFKGSEEEDCNTQSGWTDYFGHKMIEFDYSEQKETNSKQSHDYGIYSFASFRSIDEFCIE